MKKKTLFIILILNIILSYSKVSAKIIPEQEINPSSYIIGNYMFTRKQNEHYTGKLNTSYIMLSSKSIKDNDISKMIIYYKSPRGKWYDAITGLPITPPKNFDIKNIDLSSIEDSKDTPYIPSTVEQYNKDKINPSSYIIGTHIFNREKDENYNGQLSTKYIMLASKTIEGTKLEDMLIYYKNSRGKWYDAITGKSIPSKSIYNIEYINTKNIIKKQVDINNTSIQIENKNFIYDGKEKKPIITINYENKQLIESKDYTVEYKNNINAGNGNIIIKGINNYQGTKTINFIINKNKLSIPNNSSCNNLKYNGKEQKLINNSNLITYSNNIKILAKSYTVKASLKDKNNYQWIDNSNTDKDVVCTINKLDSTITVKDQTIKYGSNIVEDEAKLTDQLTGDTLYSIKLTPSTTNVTKNGTITASNPVIKNKLGNDVTENYNIKFISGKLIITPPEKIILETFDNSVQMENLDKWQIKNPSIKNITTETEDKGILASFDTVGGYAWAQRYHINNVQDKIKMVDNNYYLRLWVASDNINDLGIGLYLMNGSNEFYIDNKFIKLINSNGQEVNGNNSFNTTYEKTHKFLPGEFHGWVNFPISAITNSNGKKFDINQVNELIIDIRPENPNKNTFYILDNLILTNNIKPTKYNNNYEINYRRDLVGIKYSNWYDFWHSPAGNNNKIYNITNILNNITEKGVEKGYGPQYLFHYWGKPALGYYKSTDKEVIKKHMEDLNAANVDFIFIDFTNLSPKSPKDAEYYENYIWKYQVTIPTTKLLDTMNELKKQGINVPHVVFWASSYDKFGTDYSNSLTINQYVMNRLYDEYISKKEYKDLFVYYNNKPLVIGTNPEKSPLERNITYRYMWALQKDENDIENNEWTNRIIDNNIYGKDSKGNIEEMAINVAYSSWYMSLGKFADKDQIYRDNDGNIRVIGRNHGKTFNQYWQNAFQKHPKILMVSSWNEWGAQRIIDKNAPCGDYCFTDQYNEDFSEDIEPMSGGHKDQYYLWLKQYINDYKNYKECPNLIEKGY